MADTNLSSAQILSNPNNENNNKYNNDNEQHRQISFQEPLVLSGDSMSMTSSFSHSHLETDTTHSHDHLTGGISRTSTPAPHPPTEENETSKNYTYDNPSSQKHGISQESSHIGIYMPPAEPPPSTSYPIPPPPIYSEPPQYTPPANQIRSKKNSDATIEAGYNDRNMSNIEEIKSTLQTDKSIRMAFVRKVYSLLAAQLFLTIILSVFFMYYDPAKKFVNDHQWLFFVSWIMTFITLLVLFWQRKRSPLNLLLLLVFTLFMSYGIGTVVSMYEAKVVLQAFLITLGVFLALQVFTFQSKYDFSSWGPFLYAALWIVIFASIIGWLFPYDKGYHIAISVVAALLFSAYIIYDTYMIINRVSPEEYILATVDLYLDVLNLFVAIIAIIGGTSDR